jgi:murein DD-endopeptidase MepM/ murein hydrolase activator NlpD
MMSAHGTPIVAVVNGLVRDEQTSLGGNSIYLSGANGNGYFYAHLDSFASSGAVAQGTIIGYVGDTGDAGPGNYHLHFEVHPGGGPAVDPYPSARNAC